MPTTCLLADPLFGLIAAYKADTFEKKVDLGVGAYRADNAKPWILPVVKEGRYRAEEIVKSDPDFNHEYLPIAGLPAFTSAAAKLVFGADSPVIKENKVASLQTIPGTGAVHLGALFLNQKLYFSNPTWANHAQIFSNVSLPTTTYPYWDPATKGLNISGLLETLEAAPEGSISLLHACAYNPTGVDPTQEQWVQIAEVMGKKRHFFFFDCAYQGFASGDLANDAWAVRYFAEAGFEMCVAQSFSKSLGLYGQRARCFHFLQILQRSEISNPPAYGAKIAATIFNNEALFKEWEDNLRTMSGRIIDMRKALPDKLVGLGTPGDWSHITKQIGMFSLLRGEYHVYLTKNGRISMA
ncbi:pyridoxal phosphate-dependent transferase [Kalaharituber pfeilii]|nr:pyridoxal phosphate-dependent transferase [Kalaharituber pfeilii]